MRVGEAMPSTPLPYLVDVCGPGIRRSLAQLSRIADRSFRLLGHVEFEPAGQDRLRMRFERETIARRIMEDGVLALSRDLQDGAAAFRDDLQSQGARFEVSLLPAWQATTE